MPAEQWRQGLTLGMTGPLEPWFSVVHAEPGAVLDLRPDGPSTWEFDLPAVTGTPQDPSSWSRLALQLTAELPLGSRVLFNGEPLTVVATGQRDGTYRVHGVTGRFCVQVNEISLRCEDGTTACALPALVSARTWRGFASVPVDLGPPQPDAAEVFAFEERGPLTRRRAAWLVVALNDQARPTVVRWGDAADAVLVQGGQRLGPEAASGPGVWKLPLPPQFASGRTLASFCTQDRHVPGPIGSVPNVAYAYVLLDYSEDPLACMPNVEACGTGLDEDCDGATDETAAAPCDGDDVDGCAFGRATCTAGTCQESWAGVSWAGPILNPAPASFVLSVASVDAVFEDGGVAQVADFPATVDIVAALTNGAHLAHLDAVQSPLGGTHLLRYVFHLAAAPTVLRNGIATPVAIRSTPGDDGLTLILEFRGGTDLAPGEHLVIVGDNSPGLLPVDTFFSCPGGDLTFPSKLFARNACEWPGVNCAAATGPGALCDTSPDSLSCPGCSGDYDGCRVGHLLPMGPGGALVCMADDQVPATLPPPAEMQVALTGATFYYDRGDPIEVVLAPTWFDLVDILADGTVGIPGLVAPTQPTGHPGARILGIRLLLDGPQSAQIPDGSGGWVAVSPRSGPEDSGDEITLEFGGQGTWYDPGQPVRVVAQVASSPDGWRPVYQCGPGSLTVLRRILVANPCENGGCAP